MVFDIVLKVMLQYRKIYYFRRDFIMLDNKDKIKGYEMIKTKYEKLELEEDKLENELNELEIAKFS